MNCQKCEVLLVYLVSYGVNDEIQSPCQSENFCIMQISATIKEKSLVFNIFKSMYDNVSNIVSMLPICKLASVM